MYATRVDGQFGLILSGAPARVHEQRVVKQRVESPDREERRRKIVQVGLERRNIRVALLPRDTKLSEMLLEDARG